jgi:predicted amidohydrolase
MTSGANVLARPVGVPAGDGRAHWEVLLRARAVEQAYVLRRRSGVWSSTT